jgi:CMD domain protein
MSETEFDVIDRLAGITPGSPLDAVRAGRSEARRHAQLSYKVLFTPEDMAGISAVERFAMGRFVAGLHAAPEVAYYEAGLAAAGASEALREAVALSVEAGLTKGPYGRFPVGPLSSEDSDGLVLQLAPELAAALGPRLTAAFQHLHMLVFHPRDSSAEWLQALLDAGWTTTDIVTLSQITAFLAFQLRMVAGLRVLAAKV